MVRVGLLLSILFACLPTGGSAASREGPEVVVAGESEVLHFRWRLEGIQGVVARIFGVLPTSGDGVMTVSSDPQGRLEARFTATSEKAGEADHWTYETLVDLDHWRTLRVRESYRFREKQREKSFELSEREVIDLLSGLQQLRRTPLSAARRSAIWSGGKTYPVTVSPKSMETRLIEGREVALRLFEIRGFRSPGERTWRARADVWLTNDADALPVEMIYRQRLGRLRLTLIDPLP